MTRNEAELLVTANRLLYPLDFCRFSENDFESLTYNKPSAIITGRQDDSVGYKDMFKLLDNFPRAGFSILDGAGHNLQIEQPELFREYFRNWLKRTRY